MIVVTYIFNLIACNPYYQTLGIVGNGTDSVSIRLISVYTARWTEIETCCLLTP